MLLPIVTDGIQTGLNALDGTLNKALAMLQDADGQGEFRLKRDLALRRRPFQGGPHIVLPLRQGLEGLRLLRRSQPGQMALGKTEKIGRMATPNGYARVFGFLKF